MVFGRKNKQQPQESISMNEAYSEDYNSDLINQSFGSPSQPLQVAQPFVQQQQAQQPMQMPQQIPQQMQPVQMQMQMQRPQVNLPPIQPAMQMQPMQIQQVQQPVSQAMIVGVEMSTEGEFIYKVVTNYLLNLGHCQLVN